MAQNYCLLHFLSTEISEQRPLVPRIQPGLTRHIFLSNSSPFKSSLLKLVNNVPYSSQLAYGTGCPSCGAGVDKLTSLTDAKGHTTTFQYNLAGGLIRETDALGNFKSYAYDAAGNRSSRTDEKTNITQYGYDNLNRLIQVSYPDGTTKSFSYDSRGNMISAANQDISYSFSYDQNNRLTGILDSNGRSIAYQYDALGNRTQMATPDGRTITYAYNGVNRLTGILSSPGPLNFSFSYDSSGRRTQLAYPNGVTTTYSYSPSSYLTTLVAQKLQQSTVNSSFYSHDGMGNRTAITDLSGTHNYTYDNTYQLIQATHPNIPLELFSYDAVGNKLSSEGQAPSSGRSTEYVYDFENRLIEVNYTGMMAQYKYDPFGRRIEKDVNRDITTYFYDSPNIITEYDGNGNVKNAYLHSLAIDDPLALQQGGQIYYYHKDGLGSITEMTDASVNIVRSFRYNSFGGIISQTGNLNQPFAFAGREFDAESGLYYYRARYYDPRAGRFLTQDPIGFGGRDVNFYRYVGNNPIKYKDPLGLETPWDELPAEMNPFHQLAQNYYYAVEKSKQIAGALFEAGLDAAIRVLMGAYTSIEILISEEATKKILDYIMYGDYAEASELEGAKGVCK